MALTKPFLLYLEAALKGKPSVIGFYMESSTPEGQPKNL